MIIKGAEFALFAQEKHNKYHAMVSATKLLLVDKIRDPFL